MRICFKCNKYFDDDFKYCPYCGQYCEDTSIVDDSDDYKKMLDKYDKHFMYSNRIVTDGDSVMGLKSDGQIYLYGYPIDKDLDLDFIKNLKEIVLLKCKDGNIAALQKDGTVKIAPALSCEPFYFSKSNEWKNITSVAIGLNFAVGLRDDGTVVACGDNSSGQCNVDTWKDIVSIDCTFFHTVGLDKYGRVFATQSRINKAFSECEDIVSIACGELFTVGLKKDGTLISEGIKTDDMFVDDWHDIVSISCGEYEHIIGLKNDGSVVAAGKNVFWGPDDVENWKDIVAVSCTDSLAMGLKSDGTVVTTNTNFNIGKGYYKEDGDEKIFVCGQEWRLF